MIQNDLYENLSTDRRIVIDLYDPVSGHWWCLW